MQKYHKNAKTNTHIRSEIQTSNFSKNELALKYRIHVNTVSKWSTREFVEDKSSRPNTIHYALSEIEKEIIKAVRKSTWFSAEQIVESLEKQIERINKSNVSRCLKANGLNKPPEEQKERSKLFKEYKPGFLHVDVSYLPKINGIRWYLFVAIDRATRIIYFEIYENKTALNAVNFLRNCQEFYGFKIEKVLTDNGFEFTNKYCAGVKDSTVHRFDELCEELEIEHRLIKPYTPKTNGMVERVNRTIKESTIRISKYNSVEEMREDLLKFMKHYNLVRRHTSLKKEIKVKTPIEAYKFWYDKEPNLFHKTPDEFYQSLLNITW
jgi:transposase InsO family protein